MHIISVIEAQKSWPTLLDKVETGHTILITRQGKPLARLVPAQAGFDRANARRAADGLRVASKGQTLGGLSIKDLVGEGRR